MSGDDTGDVIIGLTDAQGDFLTYTVDVLSLTLTKQNGAEVDTLPLETRVDFAQYTEMTEFLTAATVSSGIYVKAVMTLDYGNADIQVEDADGNPVQVDNILDENGNELSILDVAVHLEDRDRLIIAPGIPAHLTLDFDLKASNGVEFDNGVPTVTVEPILLADVNPVDSKIHRLRGPLKEVDLNSGSFEIIIRPFIHVLSGGDRPFGILEVITDDQTVYEINGDIYLGADGLTVLGDQQVLTAVIAMGDLNEDETQLDANFDNDNGHGHVRMHHTTLKGDVVAAQQGLLIADLKVVDGRRISLFDFTGTVSDPDNNADPQNYDIDTGLLDLTDTPAGAPVKVRGFVTPFGHGPEDVDFEATTVVDVSAVKGLMFVGWRPASAAAIEDLTKDGYTVNLAGIGMFHHLKRAGVVTDLADLTQNPAIVPDADSEGLFLIVQGGSSQLFFEFESFSEELALRLTENAAVKRITATGAFDDATATMTANWVKIKLK